MTDFVQTLKDAFPFLGSHSALVARLALLIAAVGFVYSQKKLRARICNPVASKLCGQIFVTSRWLYVYHGSQAVHDWKYYTSETTGGNYGDDIIWTLVRWPSLKPKDSFKILGAVGMLEAIEKSQVILDRRWHIVHDPDKLSIGPIPARGLVSKLRRVAARTLHIIGTI
jgi:hypothetical protein